MTMRLPILPRKASLYSTVVGDRVVAAMRRAAPVGVISNPFGREVVTVQAHATGVVLGTTTLPRVDPGDATEHVAILDRAPPVAERYARVDGRGRPRLSLEF